MLRNRRLGLAGSFLVMACALTACGSDDTASDTASDVTDAASPTPATPESSTEPSPSVPAVPASAPACADVWTDGAKLARSYAGCETDGAYTERDVVECSSGQRLVRFDDAFYAVLGGIVQKSATTPLVEDKDYLAVMEACSA